MRISNTFFGAYLRLLTALTLSNMPRQLRSRLRAQCSGSANKSFEGLKGPERSTKLFMVLTGPWDARKNELSENAVRRSEGILGCLITRKES